MDEHLGKGILHDKYLSESPDDCIEKPGSSTFEDSAYSSLGHSFYCSNDQFDGKHNAWSKKHSSNPSSKSSRLSRYKAHLASLIGNTNNDDKESPTQTELQTAKLLQPTKTAKVTSLSKSLN